MDIGYCDGLIVLRKRQPLTSARVRALLAGASQLPAMTSVDGQEVSAAIREARHSRRSVPR